MLTRLLAAGAVAFAFAGPAMAFQCPADMAEIDAALASNPQVSDEALQEAHSLRQRGEELHAAGDHQASVDALAEAKALLGIGG